MPDLTGKTVAGRYEILEKLGEGGFAEVWKAKQLQPEGMVAIKILLPDQANDEKVVEEFLREAGLYVGFRDDPNIATILECGHDEENNLYFLVMTLLGDSVEDLLKAGGPLPPERVYTMAEHIGHALEAVHGQSLVHRDIKCSNIMMLPGKERYVLVDFGIGLVQENAEKTAGTQDLKSAAGTWAYASPEQIRARKKNEIGPQSDFYSLGVTLYRAATGEYPFPPDFPQVMIDHVEKNPPDPRSMKEDMPAPLAELILRCMRKTPEDRFGDARELRAAVRAARAGKGADGTDAAGGGKRPGGGSRRPLLFAAAVLTPIALFVVLYMAGIFGGGGEMVRITSEPPGASFSLYEGEKARFSQPVHSGVTPAEVKLAPGPYSFDLSLSGYFSREGSSAEVAAGESALSLGTLERAMSLRVVSTPAAATASLVWLDEARMSYSNQQTPCLFEELHAGPHELHLSYDGYVTLIDTVDVRGSGQEISRTLEPGRKVTIWLFTDPEGAAAWIDGHKISQPTNCEVRDVPAGPHRFAFEREGYGRIDTMVVVNTRSSVDTLNIPLTPAAAPVERLVPADGPALVIRSTPEGATVLLNGENTGKKTPCVLTEFPTGNVSVQLERSCYRRYEADLSVPAGGLIHDARLSGFPDKSFKINTVPAYADVYVDGSRKAVNRGGMPPWDLKLSCGAHSIRLKNDKSTPPIDVTLPYTVRPGSNTESLIFDWENRRVIERAR